MKINFNKKKIHNYTDNNNPLSEKFYTKILDFLNNKNIEINTENDYRDTVNISVNFSGDRDKIVNDFEMANNMLGAFVIADVENSLNKDVGDHSFDIILYLNDNELKTIVNNHIDSNPDKNSEEAKYEMLFMYFTTLTHEIQHAMEFIENSNGMSASEIENFYGTDNIEQILDRVSTGFGMPKYKHYYNGIEHDDFYEIDNITEERVEMKGMKMLSDLNIDLVGLYNKYQNSQHRKYKTLAIN